jgi:cysteine desulfurase family protein
MIYLDNAATTFPKPPAVLAEAVLQYAKYGCSPGRGGYDLSVETEQVVSGIRKKIALFFGASDPDRVVFTHNATDALNLALQGLLPPGDHVVSTRLEHNSVLRPLHHLRQSGRIGYDLVPFDGQGFVDPDDIASALRPNTRLVVVNHASNVLGTVQPIVAIGRVCEAKGVPLLIDAAQSAGLVPIDMTAWNVSALAFTGHKALYGPTGVGGLVVAPGLEIDSTRFGGTGVESQSPVHTQTWPYRLEAGTLNTLGIFGLAAGLNYVERQGIENIRAMELALARKLRRGLAALAGVTLYGEMPGDRHVPIVTCNVAGKSPTTVGDVLDGDFDIAVRTGLQCAPLVHEDMGAGVHGAVRFSPGMFNTDEDVDRTIEAMHRIAGAG